MAMKLTGAVVRRWTNMWLCCWHTLWNQKGTRTQKQNIILDFNGNASLDLAW